MPQDLRSRLRDYYRRRKAELALKAKKRFLGDIKDDKGNLLITNPYMWYDKKTDRRYLFRGPVYQDLNQLTDIEEDLLGDKMGDEIDYALKNFKGMWHWRMWPDLSSGMIYMLLELDHPDDAFWVKMQRDDYEDLTHHDINGSGIKVS